MSEWKPGRGMPIETLFAWIACMPGGGEAIAAHEIRMEGRDMFAMLAGADRERVESYRTHAEKVAAATGRPVRLVRFARCQGLDGAP